MLKDGTYKEAKDLTKNDLLMSYNPNQTFYVLYIKHLPYTEDVYDLTIADNHNFLLSAGIFVHNSKDAIDAVCGAIYNASFFADEFSYNYGESVDITTEINSDLSDTDQNFETSLLQKGQVVKQNTQYLDFGYGESQEFLIEDGIIVW